MRLTLPPTSNHRLMVCNGRLVLAGKDREYQTRLKWEIRANGVLRPLTGDLKVTLYIWQRRVGKNGGDIDGRMKNLFDACNGALWVDDSQISELHVFKKQSKDQRIELEVETCKC